MKKILGLDLGTNSIGWALVEQNFEKKQGSITGLGSRIIPMSQDVMDNFGKGQSHSQTADRTHYRSVRRLYQRDNLRRERLHRVLHVLDFLPQHYDESIDFIERKGQFKELQTDEKEVKLNYQPVWNAQKNRFDHEFIFMDSFKEMLADFQKAGQAAKLPYDWTLYFLRKKALTNKIGKEELAWILLNFNQKRGYYQLRGEEEEVDNDKQKEFCVLKVSDVVDSGEQVKGKPLYNVMFDNGWVYDRQITQPDSWIDKTKEFIVTTTITAKGETKRTFKAVDSEKDWIAIKQKTEQDIEVSDSTVGEYIYNAFLQNPKQKIRGELIRTIERKRYKDELKAILKTQCKLHAELMDRDLYQACLDELYPKNLAHRNNIKDRDFSYLFLDDIIFYQRPLKSKKSSISSCAYEMRTYKKRIKENNGEGEVEKEVWVREGVKAVPKSHPMYQEFRLWQFIKNLRVYTKEAKGDVDVSDQLLAEEDQWVDLFDYFNSKKEIEQKHLIDFLVRQKLIERAQKNNYRWNYVEDKKYPGNETKALFAVRFAKVSGLQKEDYLTPEQELHLWHIVYSVRDKIEFEQALKTFAQKYGFDEDTFVASFSKTPPFSSDYGAYSLKAINKLLPLMRMGKYWSLEAIDPMTLGRIHKIIDGEWDERIVNRVREKAIGLESINDFKGLPLWLACYIVYNRHAESGEQAKWNTPDDIDAYLNNFKQHSLRNPIVEQVVTETLRVVRDIWQIHGEGQSGFFDEIHLELGRDMKNPADKRKSIHARNIENENTNYRIRELLKELMHDESTAGEVRAYSPGQQEILKIYEEGVFNNPDADYTRLSEDEVSKIRRNNSPSQNDIKRYKLWLGQGYVSPYTGKVIPLSRLFTTDYQIEHVIPQARYFDDSLSNKVICESEVNKLKDNRTAYEFLKDEKGRIVSLSGGKSVKLFTLDEYEAHCTRYFKNNRTKLQKLMSEDIPEGFIARQMNDSRYISCFVKGLLSHIVREENEQEATSKNILPVPGAITAKLKQDWGLNDKWNAIVAPRFQRLNTINSTDVFGYFDKSINAFRCEVPDELKTGFSKKRIDHRHHALDALVIACTTRKHVHYLNALNAEKENHALRSSLLIKKKQGGYTKTMFLPWEGFSNDAYNALQATLVSFKQNTRVINKTNNKTWQWVKQNDDTFKKRLVPQIKGDNWAIRKPLHKETVSGFVQVRHQKEVSFAAGIKDWQNLVDKQLKKQFKILQGSGMDDKAIAKYFKMHPYKNNGSTPAKLKVYYYTSNATATRTELTDKFTRKQLDSITDSGIKKILENHLLNYKDDKGKEDFSAAFGQEGLEDLNKNISALNNGVPHQPIYKVRIYEEGSKFKVGYNGAKQTKYVEAAKGTNLFFAIYWNEEKKKRTYETIALNEVIEHQKQVAGLPKEQRTPVPLNPEKGRFLFALSPNDLVYVPDDEELENLGLVNFGSLTAEQVNRVYKMVSTTKGECHFVPNATAREIIKNENGTNSKSERLQEYINGNSIMDDKGKIEMIKSRCWKLQVDRLGRIVAAIHPMT